ncbi:unnamed protein product [Mytilus edulis]|uniref:Fibrinogen C-terminal domain-containing protein n=1 Tax=Mytilus edulis TaxID=6550 RepID=A0A8S3QGV8_MYTED|nr:unnamed protein product [Mytilus edulis]
MPHKSMALCQASNLNIISIVSCDVIKLTFVAVSNNFLLGEADFQKKQSFKQTRTESGLTIQHQSKPQKNHLETVCVLIAKVKITTKNIEDKLQNITTARECSDTPRRVGVYNISPDDSHTFKVKCEAGGWTVIQKRFNGSTDFYRNWLDYENGFGDLNEEFWLGDSMTFHNNMHFSTYDRDNDRSSLNCAAHNTLKGAWWYNNCWRSSLNGKYSKPLQQVE